MLAIGLMSGTSMDGIDAALIETDGESVVRPASSLSAPYEADFRARLAAAVASGSGDPELETDLTRRHAETVQTLLQRARLEPGTIGLIGFHGHTLLHAPIRRRTVQIGDGALLARLTGIPVINDFRSADVAAGGEGAPLAPAFHRAIAASLEQPLAILNIGGVANVTWIGRDGTLLAFDTGPGNALIDDWALSHTGRPVDEDGRLAASGRVEERSLADLMRDPYFTRKPPKSLDRNHFREAHRLLAGLSAADGAATLTHFTAASVAIAARQMPQPAQRWLVTGGGRRNPALMAALAERLLVRVDPIEAVGWDGDVLEAQAFAYLAVRSLKGLPISFPETTGAPRPLSGGRYHPKPG